MVGLDKRKAIEAARDLAIPHRKTIFPEEGSIDPIRDLLGYPVVVKPLRGAGGKGVSVCNFRTIETSSSMNTKEVWSRPSSRVHPQWR